MTHCLRRNAYFTYFIITLSGCYGVLHEDADNEKVFYIGDNVRLACSTSKSSRWSHIPDGNKKRNLISTADQLSQEYVGNGRFRLDTSTGKYDLLINDINTRDAGVYFCTTNEKEYSTRLVIEKKLRNLEKIPTSVVVVKGQDVRLNCSTSYPHPVYWTHIPVGKSDAIEVYVVGVLISSYATSGRYNVEVNASVGQYDLVIRQVQLEDAGTFVCIDDYGSGMQVSANVTVLDASPVCQSNASDDGVLIENDCGLPPDLLHMTCRTTFAGSAEPQLRLKHSGVTYDAIAKETTKSDPDDQLATMISRYILQPDFKMTTEELSCELSGLHRVPSNIACDIQKFRISYFFNSTSISITKMLSPHKNEESFTCSSNSSVSCSYKWSMPHRPEEVLSRNQSVSFGPGKYMCTAECVIRGKICSFASLPYDGMCQVDYNSPPTCHANAPEDGVLIENDCGLSPDLFNITCRTTFAGSAELQLRLKHLGDTYDANTTEITRKDHDGQLVTASAISTYILQPNFRMKTKQILCELTGLSQVISNTACNIQDIKILYIFNSTTITYTKIISQHTAEEKITCSPNSSESCSYKWVNIGKRNEVASQNDYVSYQRIRQQCIVECNIRDKICSFASQPFEGMQMIKRNEDSNSSSTLYTADSNGILLIVLIVLTVFNVTLVVTVLCCALANRIKINKKAV